jgi:transcriptional regulator with XRE-family HTH domain
MEDVKVRDRTVRGTAVVIPRPRSTPDVVPLDSFHMRKGSDEPTEFGYFLMAKMADHEPPLSQAELARKTGVGQASISRWIYGSGRPEVTKLKLLAPVIDVEYDELLTLAGYGKPSDDLSGAIAGLRDVEPLARELSAMLDAGSPLSSEERELLRQMIDRLMAPYRRSMRRRRSA